MKTIESSDFIIRKNILDPKMSLAGSKGVHPRHVRGGELQKEALLAYAKHIEEGTYDFSCIPCPLCQGKEFTEFAEVDRYGNECSTVICTFCGLIQTQPMPTPDTLSKYYGSLYTPMYRGIKGARETKFDDPARLKVNFVKRLHETGVMDGIAPGSLVVEAGCGDGTILHAVSHSMPEVECIGFDFDDSYMALGRSRGLDLRTGRYASDPSIKDVKLLYYHHVFEHIRDLRAELNDITSVIADDGYLSLVVPGMFNVLSSNGGDVLEKLQNAHLFYFDLASLVEIVAPYGFELVTGNEGIFTVFRRKVNGEPIIHNMRPANSSTILPRALRHEQKLTYLWASNRVFQTKPKKSVAIILDHLIRHIRPYTGAVAIDLKTLEKISGRHAVAMDEAIQLAKSVLGLSEIKKSLTVILDRSAA